MNLLISIKARIYCLTNNSYAPPLQQHRVPKHLANHVNIIKTGYFVVVLVCVIATDFYLIVWHIVEQLDPQ